MSIPEDWWWVVLVQPSRASLAQAKTNEEKKEMINSFERERVAGFAYRDIARHWAEEHYPDIYFLEQGPPSHLPTEDERLMEVILQRRHERFAQMSPEERARERTRLQAQLDAVKPMTVPRGGLDFYKPLSLGKEEVVTAQDDLEIRLEPVGREKEHSSSAVGPPGAQGPYHVPGGPVCPSCGGENPAGCNYCNGGL